MKRILAVAAALVLASCEPPEKPPEDPKAGNGSSQEKPVHKKNHLANEKSPYLLQHAENPVDWYPWGEEALAKAKKEDKPIFLSVGYSTCHWCHVMERESFENEEIAKLMNDSFVCIKVDREERPDIDEIYMEATQALNNGQGGWPMSVFMTPEGKPFFCGTYFPPENGRGRPGFRTVLTELAKAWKERRAEIEENGDALAKSIGEAAKGGAGELNAKLLDGAAEQMLRRYDAVYGGFGGAPKFPPSMVLSFLLRERRGDRKAMDAVTHTLEMMARGGMYDQVCGGFARYSTDEEWLIPHFEKMLYDNALLAGVYTEAFQATGNAYYRRIATEILDYVLREMTSPEGAFWSATDADSEGEEGKFFVWTPEEISEVLGKEEGKAFCAYFGVTDIGNFEEGHGASVLHVEKYDEAQETRLAPAKKKLYDVRRKRVPPHLDDKILVAWNGLMISSMARAAGALSEPKYLAAAERAAGFLLQSCVVDGRLRRGFRDGTMNVLGFLDDYACLASALLDLYEATGNLEYFAKARALAADMVRLFWDEAGDGFFLSGSDQEKLIARRKDPYDGAVPSGNSVAAMLLLRLAELTGDDALREKALRTVSLTYERLSRFAPAQPEMLKAVSFHLAPPKEVVISGKPGASDFEALCRAARSAFAPNKILAFATGAAGEEKEIPLLEDRAPAEKARAFVCVDGTCKAPVSTPEDLAALLK